MARGRRRGYPKSRKRRGRGRSKRFGHYTVPRGGVRL